MNNTKIVVTTLSENDNKLYISNGINVKVFDVLTKGILLFFTLFLNFIQIILPFL